MKKEVEELIKLGKDSLVKKAMNHIRATQFENDVGLENFSKVEVKTNGDEVFVSFLNPIKYLPSDTVYYCDVLHMMLSGDGSINLVSNPEDRIIDGMVFFYKPNKEAQSVIEFVFKAINANESEEKIDIANFDDEMIIRENENYFEVTVISKLQESRYRIEKVSGKILNSSHAQLVQPPFGIGREPEFIEIK